MGIETVTLPARFNIENYGSVFGDHPAEAQPKLTSEII